MDWSHRFAAQLPLLTGLVLKKAECPGGYLFSGWVAGADGGSVPNRPWPLPGKGTHW
jgi:hypothetical protein